MTVRIKPIIVALGWPEQLFLLAPNPRQRLWAGQSSPNLQPSKAAAGFGRWGWAAAQFMLRGSCCAQEQNSSKQLASRPASCVLRTPYSVLHTAPLFPPPLRPLRPAICPCNQTPSTNPNAPFAPHPTHPYAHPTCDLHCPNHHPPVSQSRQVITPLAAPAPPPPTRPAATSAAACGTLSVDMSRPQLAQTSMTW